MLSFNSCSSLFSGIFSSPTRKGNVAPPSRAWQRVKKRSKWLSWKKNPKQTLFSSMTGEAEIILMCLVWIIYLCVYRWHCHDLEVKKSFMTFHPLNWRNLRRKFLKNNKNFNFSLLEIHIWKYSDGERQKLFNAVCLPQACGVNSWEGVAPRQLASKIGPSAVDHCSVLAATKSKMKIEILWVSVKW